MTDEPTDEIRPALLVCGARTGSSYWPCSKAAGHEQSHENAWTAWPRSETDTCPPEGANYFTQEDVRLVEFVASFDPQDHPDVPRLRSLAARIAALLPPPQEQP